MTNMNEIPANNKLYFIFLTNHLSILSNTPKPIYLYQSPQNQMNNQSHMFYICPTMNSYLWLSKCLLCKYQIFQYRYCCRGRRCTRWNRLSRWLPCGLWCGSACHRYSSPCCCWTALRNWHQWPHGRTGTMSILLSAVSEPVLGRTHVAKVRM